LAGKGTSQVISLGVNGLNISSYQYIEIELQLNNALLLYINLSPNSAIIC